MLHIKSLQKIPAFYFHLGVYTSTNGKLVVWGPVVWIPGIPLLLLMGTPRLESQTTNPNHQFTISWTQAIPPLGLRIHPDPYLPLWGWKFGRFLTAVTICLDGFEEQVPWFLTGGGRGNCPAEIGVTWDLRGVFCLFVSCMVSTETLPRKWESLFFPERCWGNTWKI